MLGAGASVVFGIAVGIGASSLLVFVGATAIALANVGAGAFVGWGVRSAVLREHSKPTPR